MTTNTPPDPHAGGERRQTVDFDLFGGDGGPGDAEAGAEALEKTAGQVDFDVFGAAEPAPTAPAQAAEMAGVDFDLFGAAEAAQPQAVAALDDTDMDAEDATRFTAPPAAGEIAAASLVAAASKIAPAAAPARAEMPASAPVSKSGTGKLVAIVIAIAAIALTAWFFLR